MYNRHDNVHFCSFVDTNQRTDLTNEHEFVTFSSIVPLYNVQNSVLCGADAADIYW